MWILTESWNLYDQQGDYFIAAWLAKPTTEQIKKATKCGDKEAEHITNGGGRIGLEDSWYYLFEYQEVA